MSARACCICGKALAAHAHRLQRICGSRPCYLERKRRRRGDDYAKQRARRKAPVERKAPGPVLYLPEPLREAARLALSAPWPAQAPGGLTP